MPELTALYVPGDRPDRFGKALASGAEVVILDLEDAVLAERKDFARQTVLNALVTLPRHRVSVRINPPGDPWGRADLEALAGVAGELHSLRVPKVGSPQEVAAVRSQLGAEAPPLHCLLENALGIENAFAIASAAGVGAVALGEADLRSELRVQDEDGLSWARQRLVVAARAAGLPAPQMSAYTAVSDEAGLARSCRHGRSLGFIGRTAIHPRQLPIITGAFRPDDSEVAAAQALLTGLSRAAAAGTGVVLLADGRLADAAMIEQAELTLELERATTRP